MWNACQELRNPVQGGKIYAVVLPMSECKMSRKVL